MESPSCAFANKIGYCCDCYPSVYFTTEYIRITILCKYIIYLIQQINNADNNLFGEIHIYKTIHLFKKGRLD